MKQRYKQNSIYKPKGNVWFHGTHPMNVPKILKTGLQYNKHGRVWSTSLGKGIQSKNWTLTSNRLRAQRGYGYDTPYGVVKIQLPMKKMHKYLLSEPRHSSVRGLKRTIPPRYIKAYKR
jgi:RNA:NAD 2'-phosphotransferase (TPT1/KptA family)